jgi:hypothetical protein
VFWDLGWPRPARLTFCCAIWGDIVELLRRSCKELNESITIMTVFWSGGGLIYARPGWVVYARGSYHGVGKLSQAVATS